MRYLLFLKYSSCFIFLNKNSAKTVLIEFQELINNYQMTESQESNLESLEEQAVTLPLSQMAGPCKSTLFYNPSY